MKQLLLLWGIVLFLYACNAPKQLNLDTIFSSHFDHNMISSGPNFPDFKTRKDSIDLFLVALHEGHSIRKFQHKAGWDDSTLQQYITLLTSKQWLTPSPKLRPTIFIANDTQGKALFEYSLPMALEIANSIEYQLPLVKVKYQQMALADKHDFESMSFLILSNVLLDNWQINDVERNFLKAPQRPERHGKYYYYSILENAGHPKEAFGIYGNQYRSVNDTLTIAVYGNNRNHVSKQLRADEFVEKILQTAPIISEADNNHLVSMAAMYQPLLLSILEKHKGHSKYVYRTMGYAEEISFEEFFIWWYHFIYTNATNILAEKGLLKIPEEGNFYYTLIQ